KKKMKKFDQKATDKIENVKRSSAEKRPVFRGTLNPIHSHTTLDIKYRQDRRCVRLYDLCVLSKAYHKYQVFYLSKYALNHSKEYNSGERTSMLMNTIFDLETTPADFIQTQDEATNELIENYQDYQIFLDKSHLDKQVLDVFCKAFEHNFGTMLKINSVAFVGQIQALMEYNLGLITKKQMQKRIVDYCIFSQKTKKLNTRLFKRTIHSIEKLYTEILSKKTLRKKSYE
ncbi:MAG: hypothetical protein ACI8QQ_002397, partial [Psychroserpens sp.]